MTKSRYERTENGDWFMVHGEHRMKITSLMIELSLETGYQLGASQSNTDYSLASGELLSYGQMVKAYEKGEAPPVPNKLKSLSLEIIDKRNNGLLEVCKAQNKLTSHRVKKEYTKELIEKLEQIDDIEQLKEWIAMIKSQYQSEVTDAK